MLACISARGKAKHSNTCFMTSKLVRSATPVKEDHSFLSLCCCFIFSIDAALRRKKSPLLKRHRFSPHAHRKYTRRWCFPRGREKRRHYSGAPLNFKFHFICLTALTLGFINHTNTLDIRLVPGGRLCLNNHHSFRRALYFVPRRFVLPVIKRNIKFQGEGSLSWIALKERAALRID
jgi:hypothetical protein